MKPLICLLGALAIAGCSVSHAEKAPAPKPSDDHTLTLKIESQKKIGLATASVSMRPIASELLAPAKMAVVPEFEAHVTAPVTGKVLTVFRRLGDDVAKGAPLAILDSTDLGQAQSDFLQAEAKRRLAKTNLDRQQGLFDKQYAAKKDLIQAQNDYQSAAIEYERTVNQLILRGVHPVDIDRLASTRKLDTRLTVRAPISGRVTSKTLTMGELIPGGNAIFTLDAMDPLWAVADVHEKDLARAAAGARVEMTAIAYPGRTFTGRVDSISEGLSPDTHTAKVRIRVANPKGLLRPEMFVDARIKAIRPVELPAVPAGAVILQGQDRLLFVALGPEKFEKRPVTVGPEADGWVAVSRGAKLGEHVVSNGALLLNAAQGN